MTVEANSSPPIHQRNAGIAWLLAPVVAAASAAGMGLSGMALALLDSSICSFGNSPLWGLGQHLHSFKRSIVPEHSTRRQNLCPSIPSHWDEYEDGRWRHGINFSLHTCSHGLRFARIGRHGKQFPRLENLAHPHGDRLLGHLNLGAPPESGRSLRKLSSAFLASCKPSRFFLYR
jgi:hypothetical protein